jgi:hypothetical protein
MQRNPIWSLLITVAIFVGLYFLVGGIYNFLTWAWPVFFIGAAVINYRVYINHFAWFMRVLKAKPLQAVLIGAFHFFLYPLVGIYLFFRALGGYVIKKKMGEFESKMRNAQNRYGVPNDQKNPSEDEFTEYEELPATPIERRAEADKQAKSASVDDRDLV